MQRKRTVVFLTLLFLLLTGCGQSRMERSTVPSGQSFVTEPSKEQTKSTAVTESMVQSGPVTEVSRKQVPSLGVLTDPREEDFVPISVYLPDVVVELPYATEDNFTGSAVYSFTEGFLRYGTVLKLEKVSQELAQVGLSLKVWDAFRPIDAQFLLWEACPDPRYVSDPNQGFSSHTRGNTLDVTVVDGAGRELEMPSDFDDFSLLADRDYSDCSEEARKNAELLQTVMEKHGFRGYGAEWWHYSDTVQYAVETVFDPGGISVWYAKCNEFITLRTHPDVNSEARTRIPKDALLIVLGFQEQFAMAEYQGTRGYVLRDYIAPVEE